MCLCMIIVNFDIYYLVFTIYHFLGDSNNSLAKLSLACASLLFLLLIFV